MFSVCNIFQFEANFGIAAAIIEALVQSHGDKVVTAPAIPMEWEHGEVKGLVVRIGEKNQLQVVKQQKNSTNIFKTKTEAATFCFGFCSVF